MKRAIAILLVFALCVTALTGCSFLVRVNSRPSNTAETAKISMIIKTPSPEPELETDDGTEDPTADPKGTPHIQEDIIGLWRCTLKEVSDSPEINGYLRFNEDGSLAFDYGDGYGPAGMGMVKYRGTWHIDSDMGPSNLPNPLVLDLSLDCATFAYDEEYFPSKKNGVYSPVIENDCLFLSFVDGDSLYSDEGEPLWSYNFERDDSPEEELNLWKLSDSELIEHVKVLLYENFNLADTSVFYPAELNKWEGNTLWYGFVYEDGNKSRYAWLNMMTEEFETTDEVENYTGEG